MAIVRSRVSVDSVDSWSAFVSAGVDGLSKRYLCREEIMGLSGQCGTSSVGRVCTVSEEIRVSRFNPVGMIRCIDNDRRPLVRGSTERAESRYDA